MHWSVAVFAAVLMCFFILLSTVAIQPGKFAETLKNFMAAPVLWLLNAVPVIVLFGAAWAICANVFWAGALTSLVFDLLSIINLIKIEGRNDPLTAADFGLITEALQATGEYKLNLHIWLIVLTVLASALLILAGIKIKSGKWIPVRAAAGVLSVTLMAVMMAKVYPSEDLMGNINVKVERRVKGDGGKYSVYNVPAVFDNTGFIYGFFRTFNSNKIERPSGYSKSAAASWERTGTPAVRILTEAGSRRVKTAASSRSSFCMMALSTPLARFPYPRIPILMLIFFSLLMFANVAASFCVYHCIA